MFTGIVEALCPVREVSDAQGRRRISIQLPSELASSVAEGDSVSVNGVCLTLVARECPLLHFDVVQETLNRSNLSLLSPADEVNVERSLRYGDRIGGHLLSGHIWSCVPCTRIEWDGDNIDAWFALESDIRPYLLPKGFVALDGVSLTIAAVEHEGESPEFSVSLIPETRRRTRFGSLCAGQVVNLELDAQTQAIVDTVTRLMAERYPGVPSAALSTTA